jgi:hypothetical protein
LLHVEANFHSLSHTYLMNTFHCDHCRHLVFFENVRCERCWYTLGYLHDLRTIVAFEASDAEHWRSLNLGSAGKIYRKCSNYQHENVCNWMVSAERSGTLCESCRFTQMIPQLSVAENRGYWFKLEQAKRRLLYTLYSLDLTPVSKADDPEHGLAFNFLADHQPHVAVVTGYHNGVITINVAEADDAQRERLRTQMGEPYRTLLGHLRHEIGHYYWHRLLGANERQAAFRHLFGDEREDYATSLRLHYQSPKTNWEANYITAYASAHPWEDWAETWAHYLHMVDTIDTSRACGLALLPERGDEPFLSPQPKASPTTSFDEMLERWFPLTYVLNSLNRSLGMPDGYPFTLAPLVQDKLRFVHDVIRAGAAR